MSRLITNESTGQILLLTRLDFVSRLMTVMSRLNLMSRLMFMYESTHELKTGFFETAARRLIPRFHLRSTVLYYTPILMLS